MLRWLFGRRATNTEKSLQPTRISGTNTPHQERSGRRGICLKCGALKSGSFVDCPRCGFIPVSDRDLATSLALNEAQQGTKFLNIAQQIEAGGTVQLNSRDLERTLADLETQGLKRMLGRSQETYVRQDKVEAVLNLLAQDAADGLADMIAAMGSEREMGSANPMVLAGLAANAALRCATRAVHGRGSEDYVIKALPFRLGRAFCNRQIFDIDDETRARFMSSFDEVMAAVSDAEQKIGEAQNSEWDALYESIIFGDAPSTRGSGKPRPMGFYLGELEDRLDDRNYGNRL